jgi:hypothetical protein
LFGYNKGLITGLADLSKSKSIFGTSNLSDFITNLKGKSYPVYIGFLANNDGSLPIPFKHQFDLAGLGNTDLASELPIINNGTDNLNVFNTRIEKIVDFIMVNQKFLTVGPKLPAKIDFTNVDFDLIESDLIQLLPIYDNIIITPGKTLTDHVKDLVSYYKKLIELSVGVLIVEVASNTPIVGGTGYSDEKVLSLEDYTYDKNRILVDGEKIIGFFNPLFNTKTATVKTFIDQIPKFKLPFSKFVDPRSQGIVYANEINDFFSTETGKKPANLLVKLSQSLDYLIGKKRKIIYQIKKY